MREGTEEVGSRLLEEGEASLGIESLRCRRLRALYKSLALLDLVSDSDDTTMLASSDNPIQPSLSSSLGSKESCSIPSSDTVLLKEGCFGLGVGHSDMVLRANSALVGSTLS